MTGYCILAKQQQAAAARLVALRKRVPRRLRRTAGANAIVGPALGRDDRRDSDVAGALVRSEIAQEAQAIAEFRVPASRAATLAVVGCR